MDRGEGIVTTLQPVQPVLVSEEQDTLTIPAEFQEQEKEVAHEAAEDWSVNPSDKILHSLQDVDVEQTFERLARGELKNSPKPFENAEQEVHEESEEPDTREDLPVEKSIESHEEQITADTLETTTAGSDQQALFDAIRDGRDEDAHQLLDQFLEKNRPAQINMLEANTPLPLSSEGALSKELAQTKEQLTYALKTMHDVAEVLKKMLEEEQEDEKKKTTLIELLMKITEFLFAAFIAEVTRPEAPTSKEPSQPVIFRSALFNATKSPTVEASGEQK